MSDVTEAVAQGIEEIRRTFEECAVEMYPDGSGGAVVVVRDIPLGCSYVQAKVWIGFHITYQYPYADVYPHFTNGEAENDRYARFDVGQDGGGDGGVGGVRIAEAERLIAGLGDRADHALGREEVRPCG